MLAMPNGCDAMTPRNDAFSLNATLDQRYRRLIESIKDYAIYMLTIDGFVDSWNPGAQLFKGYTADEIIGQHFSRFYTEEDKATGLPARALRTAAAEGNFESEGWRVRKDGTRFWAHVVIDPVHGDNGELIGFAKITRDISDKRASQLALIESERRFRHLVKGVKDYAIYMLSPTGVITNWNTGGEHIKGYTADEIVGRHFSCFYAPEDKEALKPQQALEIAAATGKFEAEGWRVRKDGTRFWAHVVIDAIHDDDDNLIGFAKITRDVTEKRNAEKDLEIAREALIRSQKLESIGKLTGGVAHDFNNILQVISGNLQLLQSHVVGNEVATKRVESAIGAVDRGSKLSSQLLAFARRQPLQPAVIHPPGIIRGLDDMLKRALGETIAVETVVAAGIWNTTADPHQLENVLLNLAINARDAMPDGGKLTIEIGNAMLDDDYVAANREAQAGQYVVFAVSDTGCGMTREVLEKACDPFFTTKREGQGTGLGLSMAYGFVKQSSGHFKIYSEPGHGTTIRMYFPRSLEQEAEVVSCLTGPVTGGSETILVVEDDIAVQTTVISMLSGLGYRVLKANNAENALVVLKSGIPVDLLFTDVVMPGDMRSPELARQARQLFPDIEVLFTSGYTQNAIVHGGRLDPGVHLISKPYRREQLAKKIRHLLANRQQSILARSAPQVSADARQAASGRKVLVVEDNIEARVMACEMLASLGYHATAAATAEEAMQTADKEAFDILFSDYSLPGMNGVKLAKCLKKKNPALQVVFASGYGSALSGQEELEALIVTKPFGLARLEVAMQELERALALKRGA
jgi:PAS domain S-box-containing protein